MNEMQQTERKQYLANWARGIERASARGLFGSKPIALRESTIIAGPRAGALEIFAGLDSPALLRAFSADDGAILRQFIPWQFIGRPVAFMSGRNVRVEAGWPPDLADSNIHLSDLGKHPVGGGRFIVGKNERGHTLTAGLSDDTPHWLVSGTTGSGKTTALVNAIGQLARDTNNRLILIDAKHGRDFRPLANARGLVGPLADDVYSARAALAWAVHDLVERYSGGRDTRRLVIVIDEVQELADDALATESLRKLIAQGRGANINVIVATQHPTVASLGDATIGKNLVGRLALHVMGPEASRVAVGGKSPRADYLLGGGDGYAVAPKATHRVQCAQFDGDMPTDEPDLSEWPEDNGDPPDNSGWPSGPEVGAAILAAIRGDGRVRFQRALNEAGLSSIGNDKAMRLLGLGREVVEWMEKRGTSVRPDDDTHTKGVIDVDFERK